MTSQIIPVDPFDFIIFGGTGDLSERKLLPSLYHRQRDHQFSEPTRIIGASRSKMTDKEFQDYARKALTEHVRPADLDKAEAAMLAVRPHIRKFHSSEYINALANGDICVAIGFSGDMFIARDRATEADQGIEIAYSVPQEGAYMWFDQMAIPADAKHVDEAHAFLDYILRPDVAAKASNFISYANGNKASQEFIDKEILGDPSIFPDEKTLAKLFTTSPLGPKEQRVFTRIWTKIVTGQ